jgi:SPX domain protein involved in polyphosphate accumulation
MAEQDWEHVHVKVDPSTKEQWQEHVEQDDDISTVSSLVRTSVQKEIDGDYDEVEQKYDEVAEQLSELEQRVNQSNRLLQTLESANIERGEMEEMLDSVVQRMEELNSEHGDV